MEISLKTALAILFLAASSVSSFAQKGPKTCAAAAVAVDTAISRLDFATAQVMMEETLATNPDDACRRKMLALHQRMGYASGQYKEMAAKWQQDFSLFTSSLKAALSEPAPYPENEGYLYAGLSAVRSGNWKDGGVLVHAGLKGVGNAMLRSLRLEDVDMHYLFAGLAAALDSTPGTVAPVIPLFLGKWESGGNRLSVMADAKANYYLGRALHENREWAAAIPFLQKAPRDEEFPLAPEYLLGKCYNELGQYDKALAILSPLIDRSKDDWVIAEYERARDGAQGR